MLYRIDNTSADGTAGEWALVEAGSPVEAQVLFESRDRTGRQDDWSISIDPVTDDEEGIAIIPPAIITRILEKGSVRQR